MTDKNALGERGELIFSLLITKFHGRRPLFRVAPLGAKWPTSDFVVELVGSPGRFFFVQVKSTRKRHKSATKVYASASKWKIQQLLSYAAPSFVVAVDERQEKAFLVRPKAAKKIASIERAYPLDDAAVRSALAIEVKKYWSGQASNKKSYKSVFEA